MAKLFEGNDLEQKARELGVDISGEARRVHLDVLHAIQTMNCRSALLKQNGEYASHGCGFLR